MALGGRVGSGWRCGSSTTGCRAAGAGWWGSRACTQGGRGPFSWGTCNHRGHQHSCPAGPGPRGPRRHCLLIKLRPGSKHSSSAASPPARLQTRVKTSTARGREDLKRLGITAHVVKVPGRLLWGSLVVILLPLREPLGSIPALPTPHTPRSNQAQALQLLGLRSSARSCNYGRPRALETLVCNEKPRQGEARI